jgi:hypothetical protein
MANWDKIVNNNYGEVFGKSVEKTKKLTKKINFKNNDIILSRYGIKISIDLLNKLDIKKKLIKNFSVKITTITGFVNVVHNHITDTSSGNIIFPRFGVLEYINDNFINFNFINKINSGEKPDNKFIWTGEFKGNQPVIAEYIMKNQFSPKSVSLGRSGLILNLQAGQGKTFLAAGLIEKFQRKTLVVCHNRTIMFQWIDVLKKSYPDNKITTFYGENREYGDVIVGIINTLVKQPISFFRMFGYVIFDEVHEYCSKSRKTIYSMSQSRYMLGLSATPKERTDDLDMVNVWNCGSVLDAKTLVGYSEEDIPFKGEVSMIKYLGPLEFTKIITNESLDIMCCSKMVSQLCEDYYRIHLIVKLVYDLRKKNMNIFIFADRRNYLIKIQEELERFKIINELWYDDDTDMKSNTLLGGASADEIKNAETHSNVILTTYQFMGTGKSIPKMDAIILTTPRKRKSRQYINRIFRLGSNYDIVRKIIDIVDWSTPFKSQWYKRKEYYDEMKYKIEVKKINYTELEEEMLDMNILTSEDNNDVDVIEKSLNELEKLLNKKNII